MPASSGVPAARHGVQQIFATPAAPLAEFCPAQDIVVEWRLVLSISWFRVGCVGFRVSGRVGWVDR